MKNPFTEATFNFDSGGASATISYGESNPVDPAVNATLVIDRAIVYAQVAPLGTYAFDVTVSVTGLLDGFPILESDTSEAQVTIVGTSQL